MGPWGTCLLIFLHLASAAYDCTGKPRGEADVRARWLCTNDPTCNYDARTRPNVAARMANISDVGAQLPPPAAPEDIWTVLQINSLHEVNTKDQTFEVEVYLRVFWIDYRLAYDAECLHLGAVESLSYDGDIQNEIWTPNIFSPTWNEPDQVTESGFWIAPTGRVWWARRSTFMFHCFMDVSSPRTSPDCSVTARHAFAMPVVR